MALRAPESTEGTVRNPFVGGTFGVAAKKARISSEKPIEAAPETEPRASRKARQPAMDAEAVEKYAEDFYQFAMAAYDNMREGARILRMCDPGTEVKPQSTNTMRLIRKIAGSSTDFVTKPAKAARDQGRDPKPKIK